MTTELRTQSSITITKPKTHLGNKGYTIYKNGLSKEQTEKIVKDLTVKPFVGPGFGSANDESDTYEAYRTNEAKMYVPYFYGLRNFGIPQQVRLDEGDDINLIFSSDLRENQVPVVETFLSHIAEENKKGNPKSGGLLELYTAFGKTALSLYLVSQLKKKTLVLVHKEFLMNQWIERIRQFLPEAKIGKIQGETMDVENKDIVLGMIQSISMKVYPTELFSSFGFLIIDETHHISSKVFSNALFKIVTKYTLGLSATMNRKDNTTWVIKDFLGDILYKSKQRELEQQVIVRAIDYYINDDEFNETVYDYRGNPQYSTMISRLCESNHRTEFILLVLTDMLRENPHQQIMILAHNRNVLEYLYTAINHRHITTCGYYLGGMKERDLKATEKQTVVLATYAMAAEALDIKTLSTLMMITPKTDITQSVGRILRDKNRSAPLIVDIIDHHQLFKNQWQKRKTFYKKEGYKIVHTTNSKYVSFSQDSNIGIGIGIGIERKDLDWETIYDPNAVHSSNGKNKGKNKNMDSMDSMDSDSNDKEAILHEKCLIKMKK